MPEYPDPKIKPDVPPAHGPAVPPLAAYAELEVMTNFSFLRGASHPEEFAARAKALGHAAFAVTDLHTLSGIVRAHTAAKEADIPLIVGTQVLVRRTWNLATQEAADISDAPLDAEAAFLNLLLYPTDRASYGHLCRMLTDGKRRTEKGSCELNWPDLCSHHHGLLAVFVPPRPGDRGALEPDLWLPLLRDLRALFDEDRLSLALSRNYGPDEERWFVQWLSLARNAGIPVVATNDVRYHEASRRPLQDVVTCIRLGCTLDEAGSALLSNGERHMKSPDEMARLFADVPEAIARTISIAKRALKFSLDQLKYQYPHEVCPPGKTMMEYLRDLTFCGALEKFGVLQPALVERLEQELTLIRDLNYPAYFLTVYDIVRFARSQNILCQGRGAAANSAVCYCLGITSVDPERNDLLIERFISRERDEPPDIDVDFEHERREEVIQYIYKRYGRDRAAICAEIITYRRRSAVRDVGKALGLSLDCVDRLAKSHDWWEKEILDEEELASLGIDPRDDTIRRLTLLAREILGFPRHLSQHVGGFVITESPLCELVPIENAAMPDRTFIEWDKDDIDAMGMLKMDVLALGMMTAISKCMRMVNEWYYQQKNALRHKGAEALRDADACSENPLSSHHTSQGALHGKQEKNQHLSRSAGVAEGNDAGERCVSPNQTDASGRALRPHQSDASSSGICSLQHRGGLCTPESSRLPEIFENSARVPRGTIDTDRIGDSHGNASPNSIAEIGGGGGSNPPIPDHESRTQREGRIEQKALRNEERVIEEDPHAHALAPLSALVPQCLSAFPLQLHTIPPEDALVYDMLCKADSIGVFQVESRAQMAMLPRLRPRCFYDLVIEVAIVRPGPIQGGMVHPYLRRRNKEEAELYPDEKIRKVLGRTLGVPLFQEQVMRLAMVAAGFTGGEADSLRRAMAAWKRKGHLIYRFGQKIVDGMTARGYPLNFAQRVFEQIKGFGEYGFPESHAASFALLVYASAWLKCYHPAAFCAALINSQPMGFYAPAQLVRDARDHGVTIRPIDIHHSQWECTLETQTSKADPALRLGMCLVRGLRRDDAEKAAAAVRAAGKFASLAALWRASGVRVSSLRRLAEADAFGSMGLDRQHALWMVAKLRDVQMPLFEADRAENGEPSSGVLPAVGLSKRVVQDYGSTGLSLKAHPIAFVRDELTRSKLVACEALRNPKRTPHNTPVGVAGLVLVRQRPATASGIVFITLEDESGTANLVVRPAVWERCRHALRHSIALAVWGHVERGGRSGEVVHVIVREARDIHALHTSPATPTGSQSRDFH